MTVRFWTWNHGASPGMSWNLRMWRLPYVRPLVRYVVSYPASLSNNPPGTGSTYPTPTDDADGIGVNLANWAHYFTDQFQALGGNFNDWCFCPSAIGTSSAGIAEYIFSKSTDDDVTGASTSKKGRGPLHSTGMGLNVTQATAAFTKLKSELVARGLDLPTRLEYDGERKPDIFSALTFDIDGTQGWLGPMTDGTEWRANEDIMHTGGTFLELWGTAQVSFNDSLSITNSANRDCWYFLRDFIQKTRDKAFKTAIYDPARSIFPGLQCSNYEQSAVNGGTTAFGDYAWETQPDDYISDIDILSPVFYPMPPSNFTGTGSGISDWLTALGLSDSGDEVTNLRAITVERSKNIIDSIVATGTTKKIAPWIPTLDYGPEDAPGGGTWMLTKEDIEEIVQYCIAAGVREFFVFWGDNPATNEGIAAFTELVVESNALQLELAPDEPIEGEDMALGATKKAPAGAGNGAMLLRIAGSTPWEDCIDAGGLVTADNANITNPTTQCTQEYTHIVNRQGRTPGVLELRMGYTTGLTWTASLVVRVFGRNTSDEGWTLLKNRGGSITATFSPGSSTDVSDGTLRYTTIDPMEHVYDVHGYNEVIVGVQIAPTLDVGNPTTAKLQYKLTDRPKEQPNFVDAGLQKYAVIDTSTSPNTTIVSAVTGKRIRVLSAFLVASGGANTIRFEGGTDGTALTGQFNLADKGTLVLPYNEAGWFQTAAATLLNLELSAATSVDGGITYVEVD